MEYPNIGQQCCEVTCKQLDFLPLICKCGKQFCSDHFRQHVSKCSAAQNQIVEHPTKSEAEYVCSFPSCKSKSYVPLICEKCNKHFCVEHRHIECNKQTSTERAAQLQKFTAPVERFNNAKLLVDEQLNNAINQAKKKPKTQEMAHKIQLMRMKNKASGLKSIPVTDRVYFSIQLPKDSGNKILPVFVSKTWTLGKVIDAIAEECKISNLNNISNSRKLRLFYQSGEILSSVLSCKLESLLSDQIIIDGQELILEYVDNNCTDLN